MLEARGAHENLSRIEFRQVAAETFGYQMFHAIPGRADPFSTASDLSTAQLPFVERAEVFFKPLQTVAAHGAGPIDVSQPASVIWFGAAKNHPALDILGPNGQPNGVANGTTT